MNYIAFEMSGTGLSFWLGDPCRRAPLRFFPVPFHTSGAFSNNSTLFGFVAQGLVEGYEVVFLYGSSTFERTLDFASEEISEKYYHSF